MAVMIRRCEGQSIERIRSIVIPLLEMQAIFRTLGRRKAFPAKCAQITKSLGAMFTWVSFGGVALPWQLS